MLNFIEVSSERVKILKYLCIRLVGFGFGIAAVNVVSVEFDYLSDIRPEFKYGM